MKLISESCAYCSEPITEDEQRRPVKNGLWVHAECDDSALARDENVWTRTFNPQPKSPKKKAPPKRGFL